MAKGPNQHVVRQGNKWAVKPGGPRADIDPQQAVHRD